VLESLEREYNRDEDWCNSQKNADREEFLLQLINKHLEQKEAFLKVCKTQHIFQIFSIFSLALNS